MPMEVPDVVGFTLAEAKRILAGAGIGIRAVRVTSPPRRRCEGYDDSFRVIRVRAAQEDGQVELLICNAVLS